MLHLKMLGDIILLYIHVHHGWKSYAIWFLKYKVQQTESFVILGHVLPFYAPNSPKNQNFLKMKKTPADIIILHMSTINYGQMMYGSCDMVCMGWMDRRTDGWMDKQKKWDIEVSTPPKNAWRYYPFIHTCVP